MHHMVDKLTAGPGWEAFLDPEQYWRYGFALVAATLSGIILAYHPIKRAQRPTMEGLELSKTLIIYTVVGALIAVVCETNPSMAFVIFGIGGLMRFRTHMDDSKSTGHAIMGTLIGLCWGLGLQLVAVLATIYFWMMIFFLERSQIVQLDVGGVKVAKMGTATDSYRKAFADAGCTMLSCSKNFKKDQMTFIYRMPKSVPIEQVIASVNKIDESLRGTPDWP